MISNYHYHNFILIITIIHIKIIIIITKFIIIENYQIIFMYKY